MNSKNYSYKNMKIPLINKYPTRVDISYLYDISDYNPKILLKPFLYLSSEFLVIESENDKPLHLLYCRSNNYENPQTILDFITILKRKQLLDDKIIELISLRYNLKKKDSRDQLSDWVRISNSKSMKINMDNINVSIFIQKVLDRIKVSLVGLLNVIFS